jgi:hypothetical protein
MLRQPSQELLLINSGSNPVAPRRLVFILCIWREAPTAF